MMPVSQQDESNGYEKAAAQFMTARGSSNVGVAVVRQWAKALPSGAAVLDLGCGHGVPISQVLLDAGVRLYAIDASPTMIAAFQHRFPNVPVECNAAENSDFFGHTFDGIVAWGLMFLLRPKVQVNLIHKVAAALESGGHFLFTSPQQPCEWPDITTGNKSVSLGRDGYLAVLRAADLIIDAEADDDGQNHYYIVRKPDQGRRAV